MELGFSDEEISTEVKKLAKHVLKGISFDSFILVMNRMANTGDILDIAINTMPETAKNYSD